MADQGSIRVFGHNISPERLDDVAQHYGWHVAKSMQDANAAVIGEMDGTELSRILAAPIFICVEDRVTDSLVLGNDLLTISLSAALAYKVGMATVLVDAFIHHGWIDAISRTDLLLVMHEALSNAIIHGDLEMDSMNQNSSADFLEFATLLVARLSQDAYGGRAVQISAQPNKDVLLITVCDQGKGFTPRDVERSVMGRGLTIIRDRTLGLAHLEGGRKTVISFHRRGKL